MRNGITSSPYNPTDGVKLPKSNYKPKQVLDREQMDASRPAVDKNEIWRDFFYTELTYTYIYSSR